MNGDQRFRIQWECMRLVHAYAIFIDANDYASFVGLFAQDAVWQRPEEPKILRGREQMLAYLHGRNQSRRLRHHVSSSHLTATNADHAAGITYYTVYEDAAMPTPSPSIVGEYHDQFVRTGDGWRFARRETRRLFERQRGPA